MATTEQMTLTKALSTLKKIKVSIEEYMSSPRVLIYVGAGTAKSDVRDNTPAPEMERRIQADHDVIDTLMNRQQAIKKALLVANSTTQVELFGVSMSISEAIAEKHLLPIKKDLLRKYKKSRDEATALANKARDQFKGRVDTMVGASLTNTATSDEKERTVASMTAQQEAICGPNVVDPMKLSVKIEKLESEIADIDGELDERLSVINATTIINVTY